MLHTPLTTLLGIDTPIVAATMAGVSTGTLAAHVSLAGGFGFTSPTPAPACLAAFEADLAAARTALAAPPAAPLRIGAGFIAWLLDGPGEHAACLDAALAQRVAAVWLSFGADLAKWVRHVRAYDAARAPGAPHTTLVWVVVGSVAEAVQAAREWRADVLVVQGTEAGGHGRADAPPLLTLLPLVQQALPAPAPPLVAAGGLATGAQAAAALMLGAAGAALGTRFCAAREAAAPPAAQARLLAATDSVRSRAFDEARGTTGWPAGVDGRALRGAVLDDARAGLPLDERVRRHRADPAGAHSIVWAGASVALVTELGDAADIVKSVHEELLARLAAAATVLG